MKKLRRILFTAGLILILVGISIVCFIVGRGHSIYFDNKSIEGTEYNSYAEVCVVHDEKILAYLAEGERTSCNIIGQKLTVQFRVKENADDQAKRIDCEIEIPYSLDGIIINIPAYLNGADQSVYLSEFISQAVEEDIDEVPQTDEFGLTVDE